MSGTKNRAACARRSGFTLIELMVVMAIISVLMGMVFPALHSFRERGNRLSCMNNLRQIGIVSLTYAENWRGKLPYSGYKSASILHLLKEKNLDSWEVFWCLSDNGPDDGVQSDPALRSYMFYNYAVHPGMELSVQDKSVVGVIWDAYGGDTTGKSESSKYTNHGVDGGNVFFLGGHCRFVPSEEWEGLNVPKLK